MEDRPDLAEASDEFCVPHSFYVLRDEWVSLLEKISLELVGGWESRFTRASTEQNGLIENGRWLEGPTDLLGIIGQSRRETYHCSLLSWLLNPRGSHGLGSKFLESVLAELFEVEDFDRQEILLAKTSCEVVRPHSRADLVVRMPNYTIIVEAKVDHVERPKQCSDLALDWLRDPGARFLFLTPDGHAPDTAGDFVDQYSLLSFRKVRSLLSKLLDSYQRGGEPVPAHHAVSTYYRTLEVEFP